MPCILNVETGQTHSIAKWMWDEIWKSRIEREPMKYRLVVAPVIMRTKRQEFDESVPNAMTFEYIEDLVKKAKEAPISVAKQRGRPKRK